MGGNAGGTRGGRRGEAGGASLLQCVQGGGGSIDHVLYSVPLPPVRRAVGGGGVLGVRGFAVRAHWWWRPYSP